MAIDKNRNTRKYRAALIDGATHERLWSIVFTRPAFIIAFVPDACWYRESFA